MRRTRLLGLLLTCILTSAMPAQAAVGVTALPASETVLETEADTDGNTEETSLAEADTEAPTQEVETETPDQEVETAAPAQDADKSELTAASVNDSEFKDEPAQNDDAALIGNSDQEGDSELTEDPGQKDDSELLETPEQEDASSTSGDPALTAQSAPEVADETITAEADPASNEETAYAVYAESTASSVTEKAAAGVAEGISRIHFIALNGSYSDSDAILIESNGKYGLIDSSNPSKTSSDPDLAFTQKYVDTAANGLTVVKYLTDLNVSHLEFVLATHSHSDHVGGMVDIADSGLVNNNTVYIYKDYQAVLGEKEWHNDYYANLALEAMRAKNAILLNVHNPNSSALQALGDNGALPINDSTDKVGDHIEFSMGDFLIRLFNLHTESTVNENLNSIVTTVKHTKSGSGAVLMADMEQQNYMESRTVDAIIRNDKSFTADVYKVGHHGYSSSTSYDTIETLKPANYVLSTASRSAYPWAYSLYPYFAEKLGGKLYRTSENGSAVIADFGDRNVTIQKFANKALSAPVLWKPVITDGWHMWYPDEDSYNRTGVKWTYFRSGAPVKGWINVDSNWYFADDHYLMKTGWINSGDKRFFLNNNGIMQTGWVKYENKWYFLGSDGAMQTGWKLDGGSWYFLGSDGVMRTGRQVIGGKAYLFDVHGVMQTGWASYAGKWYFLNSDGVMYTGWKLDGGKWYFLNSDGTMQIGRKVIGGITYFFNGSGAMQTGWISFGGKWYYANGSGAMQTGWIKDGGTWYYLGSDGSMQTGKKVIGGTTYFFSGSGAMQTGWISFGGKWYYASGSGAMQTGWRQDGCKWYLLGSDGVMKTGWQKTGGKTYFLNNSGAMQTGWVYSAGKWYYLDSSGAMVANKWVGDYFLKSNGEMAVNTWIGSYYVGKDGKWIPGAKKAA